MVLVEVVMHNDLGHVVGWKWLPMNVHDQEFIDAIECLDGV